MKRTFMAGFTLAMVLVAVVACVKAQRNPADYKAPIRELPSYAWTKEAWTGSDAPFLQLRESIDKKIGAASKAQLPALVARYRKQAEAQPNDAEAQFAWGYAAYQAYGAGYEIPETYRGMRPISLALYRAPSPHSYQYARLLFLTTMLWKVEDYKLRELAGRLLKRNPNDYVVKYAADGTLKTRLSAADRQVALSYAKDLVQLKPQYAKSYAALGSAYMSVCLYDDDRSACDQSLEAYDKFYRMAPPTGDLKIGIDHWIKRVKDHRAKLAR